MSSLLNQTIAGGQVGYGLYGEVERAYFGDPKKVSFVQGNVTLVQFDAVLNENHGVQTNPSAFAIEDGSFISDHIQVQPIELQLAGVKTDTPIDNRNELLRSGIVSAAAAVGGPIGILGASAALQQASNYTSQKAQNSSKSPSQAAYQQLLRLAAGTPADPNDPLYNPQTYPQVFDVITSLQRYQSMCIKSMQIQRDASTGYGIVFQMTLAQIRTVTSEQVTVTAPAQPALSADKKRLAEGENGDLAEKAAIATRQGVLTADYGKLGQAANLVRPGTVPAQ